MYLIFHKYFIRLNNFKTIYFNFKVLSFNQAIRFPIHFYGKVDIVNTSGDLIIESEIVRVGMIVFGGKHEVVISSNVPARIYNSGKIIFQGEKNLQEELL